MITLPPDDELSVYLSDAGYVVIKRDETYGSDETFIVMSKRRAIELSKALRKVSSEAE